MGSTLAVLLSGVIATLFWITLMMTFSWRGFRHGDMISIVGSDVTRKRSCFFSRGILVYAITGMLLAPFYYWLLRAFEVSDILTGIGICTFSGFAQGFLLMHLFFEGPSEMHPGERMQVFLIPASMAYCFGSMGYGVVMGALLTSYMLYQSEGAAITGFIVLIMALTLAYFVKRGAHAQLVASK